MGRRDEEMENVRRANKDCICEYCNRSYINHPMDLVELSFNGEPYLHILCNGERVKL
jgi:hypothetical protein